MHASFNFRAINSGGMEMANDTVGFVEGGTVSVASVRDCKLSVEEREVFGCGFGFMLYV